MIKEAERDAEEEREALESWIASVEEPLCKYYELGFDQGVKAALDALDNVIEGRKRYPEIYSILTLIPANVDTKAKENTKRHFASSWLCRVKGAFDELRRLRRNNYKLEKLDEIKKRIENPPNPNIMDSDRFGIAPF